MIDGLAIPDTQYAYWNNKILAVSKGIQNPTKSVPTFLKSLKYEGYSPPPIRTTVWIGWNFARVCCAMSLVCSSIATHRACQFWARNEPVNTPKTKSPAKRGVRDVIRFLYSEQAMKNVVLRYCHSSWQCSAAYCSCNKEAPEAFSVGGIWSPTIIRPKLTPCEFHLLPHMKRS